ncbi:hypothetical protein ACPEIC_46655 [Stenotrophomonas sp. NPDC087984]
MSDLGVNASAHTAEHGAAGVVAKNLAAEELMGLLVRLARDKSVTSRIEHPGSACATPLLTPHESAILALIAAGRTNAETGQSPFAATKTVGFAAAPLPLTSALIVAATLQGRSRTTGHLGVRQILERRSARGESGQPKRRPDNLR